MAFSDAVLALMRERGWKQADLVRQSGLTATTISRIIGGTQGNPTQDTQERLAAAFNIPVADLVRRAGAVPGQDDTITPEPIGSELAQLMAELSTEDRATVLKIARALVQSVRYEDQQEAPGLRRLSDEALAEGGDLLSAEQVQARLKQLEP